MRYFYPRYLLTSTIEFKKWYYHILCFLMCLFFSISLLAQVPMESDLEQLPSTPMTDARFGTVVDISGNYAIVKSEQGDKAIIYERQGEDWVVDQEITISGGGNDAGLSVAIEGTTVVIGAILVNSGEGAVLVYEKQTGGDWTLQNTFNARDFYDTFSARDERLGYSVAIRGEYIIAGAPFAHIRRADPGCTGGAIGDGRCGYPDAGAAYIYKKNGGTWAFDQKIFGSNNRNNAHFGWSVAIEGETAIVGAPEEVNNFNRQGVVYSFSRSTGSWIEAQRTAGNVTSGGYGWAVELFGSKMVASRPGIGEVIAYNVANDATFSPLQTLVEGDRFGAALDLDNNQLIIGAPDQAEHGNTTNGAVYFLEFDIASDQFVFRRKYAPVGDGNSKIGTSVALDSGTTLSGAPFLDQGGTIDAGGVFLFEESGIKQTNIRNDAYVDLTFRLDKNTCLTNNGTPYVDGVFIRILRGTQEVYTEHLTDLSGVGDFYVNTYRDFVGADQLNSYTLEVREFGPGTFLCGKVTTGETLPFQPPTNFVATDITNNPNEAQADAILLSWENQSKLADNYLILREGEIIASIIGTDEIGATLTYEDQFSFTEENSIVNGASYTYEIQTVSNLAGQTFDNDIQDIGDTYPIGTMATDAIANEPTDMVEVNWNDMSAFCEEIQVLRGDIIIATLANNATSYLDNDPTYGTNTVYTVQLMQNNDLIVGNTDEGFVPAIGKISGKAITETGDFPVANAEVKLSYLSGDIVIDLTTQTDIAGCFSFDNIVYGRGTEIQVEITKTDVIFENHPDTVTLNNQMPVFDDLLFLADIEYQEIANTIELTDYQSTAVAPEDLVNLNWNYTPATNQTTFFNIYRSGELLVRLNDDNGNTPAQSYTDLTGVPGANYTYEIKYFRIESEQLLIDSFQQVIQQYPLVAPVIEGNFIAEVDNTRGYVQLNWTHTSNNFAGFNLYRNGVLLTELSPTTTSYMDISGEPGQVVVYELAPFRVVEQIAYEAEKQEAILAPVDGDIIYPNLLPPSTPSVLAEQDVIKVRWTVPATLDENYNYSGFRVYRRLVGSGDDFELIQTINRHFTPPNELYELLDLTGIPNQNYEYQVSTYIETNSSFYESAVIAGSAIYPAVIPPATLSVNNPNLTFHPLSWTYTENPINFDGFIVYRGTENDSLGTSPRAVLNFRAYPRVSDYGQSLTYFVKAYRDLNGKRYYSTAVSATVDPVYGNTIDNDPTIPTNFIATHDAAGVIKLCWDYPEFVQADFRIKRSPNPNGIFPIIVSATERAYYDYDVEPGVLYTYDIEAIYEGDVSAFATTRGKARKFNRISGRIYNAETGIGTPNMIVTLKNNTTSGIIGRFYADSTGYYLFEDVLVPDGTSIDITATGAEFDSGLGTNSRTHIITIQSDELYYVQDFINDFEPVIFPIDTVAPPSYLIAAANYANMSMELTWNPTNNNYSGFEVFRGLTDNDIIADVPRDQPLLIEDNGGSPGFTYVYTIRTYWDTDEGRQYSQRIGTSMIYPRLLPVENLIGNEIKGQNRLAIRWSHPFDNHEAYVVTRNDVQVAAIATGDRMEFIDTTGVPGQQYIYAVYAVQTVDGVQYLSDVQTIELDYPEVARVTNLNIDLLETVNNCQGQTLNSRTVNVDWDYNLNYIDGFEIYRDGSLIEVINADSTDYDDVALPGASNTYEVLAFVEREGQRYFSRGLNGDITLGNLAKPYQIDLNRVNSKGWVEISWAYFSNEADEFIVYTSSNNPIATIQAAENTTQFKYIDKYRPTSTYVEYRVRAVTKDKTTNVTYQSDLSIGCGNESFTSFPDPPAPSSIQASDGTFEKMIRTTWEYDSEVAIDFFKVNGTPVDKGARSYDIIVNHTNNLNVNIEACRSINGTEYCSSGAANQGFAKDKKEVQTISERSRSVAVEGDKLLIGKPPISGEPTGSMVYHRYNPITGEWEDRGTARLPSNTDVNELKFGTAVAISGIRVVTSTPLENLNEYDASNADEERVFSNKIINGDILANGVIPGQANSTVRVVDHGTNPNFNGLGFSLAMEGGNLFIGEPYEVSNNRSGSVWHHKLTDGNFQAEKRFSPPAAEDNMNYGYDVDVDGGQLAIGAPFEGTNDAGAVYVYNVDDNSNVQKLEGSVEGNAGKFGYSVDISGDYLVVGAWGIDAAFVFKRDGNTWVEQAYLLPDETNNANIISGNSVAMFGDLLAINGYRGSGNDRSIYIYKRDGEDWVKVKTIINSDPSESARFAESMVMNADFLFANGDVGTYVYDLMNAPEQVAATDDEFETKTVITWDYTTVLDIDGFRIYRDEESIGTVGPNVFEYTDRDGLAGKNYTYKVVAYRGNRESVGEVDFGSRPADGVIGGTVLTLVGQAPIEGATVQVTGVVYGDEAKTIIARTIEETLTTNAAGEFLLEEIYYGEYGADFTLVPSYLDHTFTPTSKAISLNQQIKLFQGIQFFDEIAYVIQGQVSHADPGFKCGIGEVKIQALSYVTSINDPVPVQTTTDNDGNYTLVINPNQQGLEKIEMTVEQFKVINAATMEQDTIFYEFHTVLDDPILQDSVFTDGEIDQLIVNEVTTVNFEQQLTYPVLIEVKNTCGTPIEGEQFKVRIRDPEGCFDKLVTVNQADGEVEVDLPPLDGLTVTAVEAVNNTSIGNVVLEYLKYRPATLNLLTAHLDYRKKLADPAQFETTVNDINTELAERSHVQLTFHVTPSITYTNFGTYVCDEIPNKITQGDEYSVNFNVSELHNGANCDVQEGYLLINNPAADSLEKQEFRLEVNSDGTIPSYSFHAGIPNLVPPFQWGMEVKYFSAVGDFLKVITLPVAVEGAAAVPGYDVIVDPDDDIIPYPLYILRDPPGDKSKSTIKAGKTFNKTLTHTIAEGASYSATISANFKLFGVGGGTDVTIDGGLGASQKFSLKVAGTLTEAISTSTSAIGEEGDIIVGMGMAYQYGLIEEVVFSDCGTPKKVPKLGFTPAKVSTKWVYTLDQIERIREENTIRIAQIDALPVAEQTEFEAERAILQNSFENWGEILRYHREETVPHLVICNINYAEEVAGYPNESFRRAAISSWQEAFCNEYGQADLVWDEDAVNAYNNAISSIRELADIRRSLQELQVWIFDEEAWRDIDGYSDPIFDNQFGKAAENTTFSGNTSITRSLKAARTNTTDMSFSANFGLKFANSIKSGVDIQMINAAWVGLGAGVTVGTIIPLTSVKVDFKQSLAFKLSYKNNIVNSVTEAIDMSYTLSDNDAGDQHSVTVVQGISPTHTPYFYRFGGRSSCPPEDGTIARDAPKIQVLDPNTGLPLKKLTLLNQFAEQPAQIVVQVTNTSPFPEDRSIEIFLDNNSNPDGASLSVAGNALGTVGLGSLPQNVPQQFTVNIERSVAYRYDNLRIGVKPSCGGAKDHIEVSVQFDTPCSPVTIVSPDNNWVANGTDDVLVVQVRDYQPNNPVFNGLKLQYRRSDIGDDWDDVDLNEIIVDFGSTQIPGFTPPYNEQRAPRADFLGAFNETFVGTPSYPFTWIIPDDIVQYPDGEYEIRVVAECNGSENLSNIVSGTINRSVLRLLSPPQPTDGLWLKGDLIQALFNQNLDCGSLDNPDLFAFEMIDLTDNSIVPFQVVCFNNELVFDVGNPGFDDDFSVMESYDGHELQVTINQATAAVSQNQLPEPIVWTFDVVTQKLYWASDTVRVELYEDEMLSIPVEIIETPDIQDNLPSVTLVAQDGSIDSWLDIQVANDNDLTFDPDPAGRLVTFNINGNTGEGDFSEVIEINGLGGNKPFIVIEATVVKRPPNWTVNTGEYSQTMNITANWRFTDEDETVQSRDTMDIIGVFIDGELRGFGRLEFTGELGFYAAYLTVYGNPADANKTLQFEIWDARPGDQYLAETLGESLDFVANAVIGSTELPQILVVDREQNRIRYLPLNQGWTGFSINTRQPDMSINNILSSLTQVSQGDKIKSQDKFAIYEEGVGWITEAGANGLAEIDPLDGYEIYIENGPDTLRLIGLQEAFPASDTLYPGWNWVSYLPAVPLSPNDVIRTTTPIADASIIKTFNRTPLNRDVDNPNDIFLQYSTNTSSWSPPNTPLKTYDLLKIKVNNAAGTRFFFEDGVTPLSEDEMPATFATTKPTTAKNPQDPDTWNIVSTGWDYAMPLVARVQVNGNFQTDPNDQLVAFINDEVRGVANLQYQNQFDFNEFSMTIHSNALNENIEFYYYDASQDQVFTVEETLSYTELGCGTFSEPCPLTVAIFQIDIDKQDVLCSADQSGSATVTITQGRPPFNYAWSTGSQENFIENVGAGSYTLTVTDTRSIPVEISITIGNTDANIVEPIIDPATLELCQGRSQTFTVTNPESGATYLWYDEVGNLVNDQESYTINNIQSSRTLSVATQIGDCVSELVDVVITLNEYVDATFTVDDRTPVAKHQTITFTPTVQNPNVDYQWNFGDGTSSTEMIPQHTYTTEGQFDVTLITSSDNSCTNAFFRNKYIITDGSQIICESDLDTDNDGVKDDCDNCPFDSNPNQEDDDGNGYGNVCNCDAFTTDGNNLQIAGDIDPKVYTATQTITSDGQVSRGYVEFKAGESITLKAGFTVQGTTFLAQVTDVTDGGNCVPLDEEETTSRSITTEDTSEVKKLANELTVVPNPFRERTKITYELLTASQTEVSIHNMTGETILIPVKAQLQAAGRYEFDFGSRELPAGIYYVRLHTGDEVLTQRMIMLR